MLLTGIGTLTWMRAFSLAADDSKYNLCAGISNEINSPLSSPAIQKRKSSQVTLKYILYRKVYRKGGGWKVQMGNVSVSQPFRHFSFPAKPCCVQSEIKSDPDKVFFLWKAKKHQFGWGYLSSVGFFWNGSKTDTVLETYVDNDTYIGSLKLIRWRWSAYTKFQSIIYILLKK